MRDKIGFTPNYGTRENHSEIKVIGVGGGGGNAVQHMYSDGIVGVDFIICNTDRQDLERNMVPTKLVLGEDGLGAGNNPEKARELAEASKDKIKEIIGKETKMVFVTAGMGKGTGTGAGPVVAQVAKEMGNLTVGVVTYPFNFQGKEAAKQADEGIAEMRKHVDSLIIIKNENLIKYYNDLDVEDAYSVADDVLKNAVKSIAELITIHAYQNVDFNDVKTVLQDSGDVVLGLATAEGEDRVEKVVAQALSCPLINEELITEAKRFLFFVSYGTTKLKMTELSELTEKFKEIQANDTRLIWGYTKDESLGESIKLAIIIASYHTEEENAKKKAIVTEIPLSQPTDEFASQEEPITSQPVDTQSIPGMPAWMRGSVQNQNTNYQQQNQNPQDNGFNVQNNNGNGTPIAQAQVQQPQNQPQIQVPRTPNFGEAQMISTSRNYDDFQNEYNTPAFLKANTQMSVATMTAPQPMLVADDSNDSIFNNLPD
ncbi:MAG: cell division protein FtsZ [Bacteroidales bacterium]|nr:cell division protein FtsZ [Bacteroidales bacterium]